MKNSHSLIFCILLFVSINSLAQKGQAVLKSMHNKYKNGPCKSYTFSQKNKHYKGDTLSGESVWHEAIEFPDKFRINFGDSAIGNFIVFRNDSVFNYKNHKLMKMRVDSHALLLLLGGMFYRDFEDVLARVKAEKFDVNVFSLQKWNAAETYVIGAKENDLKSNQIWIDKKTLRLMRIVEKINETDMMDMRFESHQDWCKGYVETKVSFRRNGILEQEEEYFNIKEALRFPD